MNLLLLLSALLSALTGVGGSVRVPEVAQAVASVERRVAPASPRAVAARPAAALPALAAVAEQAHVVLPARSIERLWASRRRE